MDVREVPKMLLRDFSEQVEVGRDGQRHEALIGHRGSMTLVWYEAYEHSVLRLYSRPGYADDESGLNHFAEINAGPMRCGEWSYGLGNRIRETIRVRTQHLLGYPTLDRVAPEIFFLAQVLLRATEILSELPFEADSYWEAERESLLDILKGTESVETGEEPSEEGLGGSE